MLKKLLFMPYFGTLPNYFPLWLHSCGNNPGTDWLVITDNPPPANLPANVKWVTQTLAGLEQEFQKKFDFKIWLKKPYKLCDYKGFYGYLFSSYLDGYDFWGYCDCDVIFGQIDKFLPDTLLSQYDKLLRTGHLSFIRNTKKINENFFRYDAYKIVLSSSVIYGYDEAVDGFRKGLAGELIDSGYRFYQNDALPADIDFRHYPFRIVTAPEHCCVFGYENGTLYKFLKDGQGVHREEVVYMHLQKRKLTLSAQIDPSCFLVYPNEFAPWNAEAPTDPAFWDRVSTEQKGYFSHRKERIRERKRDFSRLLREPNKMKALRYRFRK